MELNRCAILNPEIGIALDVPDNDKQITNDSWIAITID